MSSAEFTELPGCPRVSFPFHKPLKRTAVLSRFRLTLSSPRSGLYHSLKCCPEDDEMGNLKSKTVYYTNIKYNGKRCFAYETERLRSFKYLRIDNVRPELLAKAGFFLLSNESIFFCLNAFRGPQKMGIEKVDNHGNSHLVKCVFCGVEMEAQMEEPMKKHRRLYPKCPFMLSMNVNNVPSAGLGQVPDTYSPYKTSHSYVSQLNEPVLNCGGSVIKRANIKYTTIGARSETFPGQLFANRKIDLARTGFYYTGSTIKCYKCHFETAPLNANASTEHAEQRPLCPYLGSLADRGEDSAAKLSNSLVAANPPILSDREVETRMDSWIFKKAIELGFDREAVVEAVVKLDVFDGDAVLNLTSIVKYLQSKSNSAPPKRFNTDAELSRKILQNPDTVKKCLESLGLNSEMLKSNDLDQQLTLNKRLKNSLNCKICGLCPADTLFRPCRHFLSCRNCCEEMDKCFRCGRSIDEKITPSL